MGTEHSNQAPTHRWIATQGTGCQAVSRIQCGVCGHENELTHGGWQGGLDAGWSARGFAPCARCGTRIPWPGSVRRNLQRCVDRFATLLERHGRREDAMNLLVDRGAPRRLGQRLDHLVPSLRSDPSPPGLVQRVLELAVLARSALESIREGRTLDVRFAADSRKFIGQCDFSDDR